MQRDRPADPALTPPRIGVLAVAFRHGRMLLVKRRFEPHAGHWGFPGGKLDSGERLADAALRELAEETGVLAEAGPVITALDLIDRDPGGAIRFHYVLVAVAVTWIAGEPVPADDAEDAGWFTPDALPAPLCPDVAWLAQLAAKRAAPAVAVPGSSPGTTEKGV